MSPNPTPDRILAKCNDCGASTVASCEDGSLRPVDNKPGTRCPTCGGTALSAHPLFDDEDTTPQAP